MVTHGERWLAVPAPGPVVAGRGDDEHAGGVGVEEGQLDRVGERVGAAGDREVDDVDAVEDRLRRPRRRSRSSKQPSVPQTLYTDHPGARRDAVDRAAVDAEQSALRDDVAGRRRGGVGAVAVASRGRCRVRLGRRPVGSAVVGVEERPRRRSACCCTRTTSLAGVSGLSPKSHSRCRRPGRRRTGCPGRRTTGARARRRCRGCRR